MTLSFFQKFVLTGLVGSGVTAIAITASLLNSNFKSKEIKSSSLVEPSVKSLPFNYSEEKNKIQEDQKVVQIKFEQEKELDNCKEIGKSDMNGKLKVCWDKESQTKVNFSWYEEIVVDSVPRKLKSLKVTYDALIVQLEEVVGYSETKRFEHSKEIFQDKGPIIFKGGSEFKEKDCSVEWIFDQNQKIVDWRANCSLNAS